MAFVGEIDQVQVHGQRPGQAHRLVPGQAVEIHPLAFVQAADQVRHGLNAGLAQYLFVYGGQEVQFPGKFVVHDIRVCQRWGDAA